MSQKIMASNFSNQFSIPQLTSIRFFAALWIVFLHYSMFLDVSNKINFGVVLPLIQSGYLGLDMFFALSGYVIYFGYNQLFSGNLEQRNIINFLAYRFIRLYPTYLLTLFVIFILYKHQDITPFVENFGNFSTYELVLCALMIQSWGMLVKWTWNIPAWTVSTEWLLYIFSPIFFLIIKKFSTRTLAFTLLFLILLLSFLTYHLKGFLLMSAMQYGIIRGTIEFLIGAIFCNITLSKKNDIFYDYCYLFIIAAIIFVIYITKNSPFIVAPLAVISVLILAKTEGFVKNFLSLKIFNYLGFISYPIYLLQFAFQNIANIFYEHISLTYKPPHLLFFFATIITLLITSIIIYEVFDKPSRVFLKALYKKTTQFLNKRNHKKSNI
jgi:peptidoglycan/LPS O-acetylase OafA/YrhL